MTEHLTDLDAATDWLLQRVDGPLRIGAPLALGKPHRLLNALYARIENDPSRPLQIYTALSLNPPKPGGGLEARFMAPFAARHFGEDFPRLAYADAMVRDRLPDHVQVEEFYMQSGALLGSSQAQRGYTSLNYTHVARALADRGVRLAGRLVGFEGGHMLFDNSLPATAATADARFERMLGRIDACPEP